MSCSRIAAVLSLASAAALLPASAPALVNVGALPIRGIRDIEIADGLAYVVGSVHSDADPTLRILDLSDPASPVEIGSLHTPFGGLDVEVAGGFAYIADGRVDGSRLLIVDVSDPRQPVEVGAFPARCSAAAVEVVGIYAYLVDQSVDRRFPCPPGGLRSSLRVIDVSNPTAPTQISEREFNFDWPSAIEAAEGVVYASGLSGGLEVIDVSDPSAPVSVGELPGTVGWDIDVVDGYLYAVPGGYDPSTGGIWGLDVIDVRDPNHPVRAGRGPESVSGARSVDVPGEMAYLVGGKGLSAVDVSDPAAPVGRGSEFVFFPEGPLAVYRGHAYIDAADQLIVVDLALPDTPTEIGRAEIVGPSGDAGLPNDVEVSNGVAYLAVGPDLIGSNPLPGSGLWTYDISDSTAPVPLGGIDTATGALDVALAAGFAFVAAGTDGLRIFDVADPSAPVDAGALPLPGNTAKLEVVGTTAYLVDRAVRNQTFRGLRVVDVSNAAAPVERGAVEFTDIGIGASGCQTPGLAVAGPFAYVTCNGFYGVDVSDPDRPALVFSRRFRPGFDSSIQVDGDRAYVGDNSSFYVYDVSDPTQPVEIYEAPGGGRRIVVRDGFAYSAASGGLSVHDLAGPLPADLLGGYGSTRGSWRGMAIAGGLLVGGTQLGHLQIVDLGPEYTRTRSVEIAIRAERESAVINLASRGVIGVAILGAVDFDVAQIDRSTLRFGPSSAIPAHESGGHLEDVDGDAIRDLVSHYRIADTGISEGNDEACVSGETFEGVPFRGCSALEVKLPRGRVSTSSFAN